MIREKINSILKSKSFYVIFSIVASIALWTYVAYVQNPDVTIPVSGIPIEFVGNDVLTDSNLIVTHVEESSLTLNFTGKRNVISRLNDKNVTAVVDLNEVVKSGTGVTGVYQLSYELEYPADVNERNVNVTNASANYITITVEKLATKTLMFRGNYDGDVAEGYQAEPMEFTPETITVSGPEAIVSQISYAFVNIEKDTISHSITEEMEFTLMDENDKEIKSGLLTCSSDTVTVKLPIVMVKEVALTVNFVEGASANSTQNVTYSVSPSSIQLSGESEILDEINQIVVGTIDLTEFGTSTTETFQIPIPNDVTNLTGETTATVTVEIAGVDTKQMTVSNIQMRNATEGYKTDIVTQSLDVLLRGPSSSLDRIQPSNIRVVADLTELGNTTGTFSVTAKVYVDGFTDVDAIGPYKITVTVTS